MIHSRDSDDVAVCERRAARAEIKVASVHISVDRFPVDRNGKRLRELLGMAVSAAQYECAAKVLPTIVRTMATSQRRPE